MALVLSGSLIRGSYGGSNIYAPRKDRREGGISVHSNYSAQAATTTNNHLCRIITQADWGMVTMLITIRKRSYSLENEMDSVYRIEAYYDNFNLDHVYGNTRHQITMNGFGVGGSGQIHENANGGYYRDAWGRDVMVAAPYYQNIDWEVNIMSAAGFMKDNSTPITDVYNCAVGSTASQSVADSWGYGRGVWFNTPAGTFEDN